MDQNMDAFPAPGWDAITAAMERLYPDQTNPSHYGTLISWQLGGSDPLQGISIYEGDGFDHFVTYGFSDLYEKNESDDPSYSGYGFELTVKLRRLPREDWEAERRCMCGILQSLGRYVFEQGAIIRPFEYIYTGQQEGMDAQGVSQLTGFITKPDEAGVLDTPNGQVELVQLVGMTDRELKAIMEKHWSVQEALERLGSDLTDYERGSIH